MSASDFRNELAGSSGEGGGDERRKTRRTGTNRAGLSSGSSQLTTRNFKRREGSERTAACAVNSFVVVPFDDSRVNAVRQDARFALL